MAETIQTVGYTIELGSLETATFQSLLDEFSGAKKLILVDENTHDYCLEYLLTGFAGLQDAEIMLLPAGEENKVMEVCFQVWEAMSEYRVERNDLVINLGGGVVTDMGGFIASVFKRGVTFVNVPTSLLAMVDASIGGKTGIDLGRYKNQLGVFAYPRAVYIDPGFLTTLPADEWRNGLAEMIKHGLIASRAHWDELKSIDMAAPHISVDQIQHSLEVKNQLVIADPTEQGERKKLNFGHTVGHALEGFFLATDEPLAHGHAVGVGMLAEAYLSFKKGCLDSNSYYEIEHFLLAHYAIPAWNEDQQEQLFALMLQDKKNRRGAILATLLTDIGASQINQELSHAEVMATLAYLQEIRRA